jgi:Tol biopolymer transport system component
MIHTRTRMAVRRGAVAWLALNLTGAIHAGNAGRDWGVEHENYLDPVTHARVWELTPDAGHADNLYFHFSNFTADNRYLLFVSDRTGSTQLFRVEVATGRVVQLTDDPAIKARAACPDPTDARRVYLPRGRAVLVLDIVDFTSHELGEVPLPCVGGLQQPTLNGDGKWLALAYRRDAGNWEIGLMSTATGEYHPVITQGFRIGHVQHSPTDSTIFYAWETGGYAPQRSWLVNDDGTGNRPFYVRTDPKTWFTPLKEWVTHEAWVRDTGEMTMVNDKLGVMLVNKHGDARLVREGRYWHAAARPDGKYLVLDDMQGRLWLTETDTGNVRLLATGLRGNARVHPHPSFDRQGHYVEFHTARTHETIGWIDLTRLPPDAYTP